MTESTIPGVYEPDVLDDKPTLDEGEAFDTTRRFASRKASSSARPVERLWRECCA